MTTTYLVCYKSETIKVHLSLDATIENLKNSLYMTTGLHPSHQYIAKLAGLDDSQSLISVNKGRFFNLISLFESDKHPIKENAEQIANSLFIKNFNFRYGNNHIPFLSCSLKEAVSRILTLPLKSRNPLILYIHNETEQFAKTVCSAFANGKVRSVLEKSYNVLPWDLSTNTIEDLENVLKEWTELQIAKALISTRKSAVFILYPIKLPITTFPVIYGDHITEIDLYNQLNTAKNVFENNVKTELELEKAKNKMDDIGKIGLGQLSKDKFPVSRERPTYETETETNLQANKENNSIGSKEFQQMMFDRLGDRDYDSFEPDEHSYLKEKIGFAKFGPPVKEEGYDENQKKVIQETYEVIVQYNNKHAEWKNRVVVSFIYNCLEPLSEEKVKRSDTYIDYNPYTDIFPTPIFVIYKCTQSDNPCRMFVDCDNRVYSSWNDYISNNKLHKCVMVLPKNGRYSGNHNGDVLLEKHASPACSIEQTLLQGADVVSAIAGMGSGVVFLGAAAVTVAPIVLTAASITGIGAGLYSIVRSGMTVYDRVSHGQSMSYQNSEARGAYLNIIAGTLGFVGAGATSVMSQLATEGVHIGEGARAAMNVLNIANTSMSAASLANASYEMYDTWKEGGTISTLSIIQLGSSILFFGNAVYNFRSANTIIDESQTNALKNHQESLRSNRHRKTFNKLVKETIRQNSGDVQAGRAEVISTISRISNRDEVLAVLTRNNRLFNDKGIRFAVENGQITLNGIPVDLMQMGSMSKLQRTQILIELPSIPKPTQANFRFSVERTTIIFQRVFGNLFNTRWIINYISTTVVGYSEELIQNILKISKKLFDSIDAVFRKQLENHMPTENLFALCFDTVMNVFLMKINLYESEYQNNPKKNSHLMSTDERAMFFLKKVIKMCIKGEEIEPTFLKELKSCLMNKITLKIFEHIQKEDSTERRNKISIKSSTFIRCKVCNGYYYGW